MIHVHCVTCWKMFREVEDGKKEKAHVLGLCPRDALDDHEYGKAHQHVKPPAYRNARKGK